MSWRVRQFIRKWTPIVLMVSALFVGYAHWQRGGRANVGSVMTSAKVAASRVPVLGTYFRGSRRSYGYSRGGSHRQYAYKRGGRRSGKARHGRRRRR